MAIHLATFGLLLSGCGALPADGPRSEEIIENGRAEKVGITTDIDLLPYKIAQITSALPQSVTEQRRSRFSEHLTSAQASTGGIRLAAGDVLQMIVWEGSDIGLLSADGDRATAINLSVDADGFIQAPFVARLKVDGLTVAAARERLLTLYEAQSANPEITLTVTKTDANTASILGDIKADAAVALPIQGLSLLDFIARAGGVDGPYWEVDVQVTRGRRRESVRLSDIFANSLNNINIQPGDIVHVIHEPRVFSVFGAVKSPGATTVPTEKVSILDLLSAAGGLDDATADPTTVFVYRTGDGDPTVFVLDLRQPDSFFLGERFEVSDDDIIYVGPADAVGLSRFFDLIFSPLASIRTL